MVDGSTFAINHNSMEPKDCMTREPVKMNASLKMLTEIRARSKFKPHVLRNLYNFSSLRENSPKSQAIQAYKNVVAVPFFYGQKFTKLIMTVHEDVCFFTETTRSNILGEHDLSFVYNRSCLETR